jgi:hypothetical protein
MDRRQAEVGGSCSFAPIRPEAEVNFASWLDGYAASLAACAAL